jgi:GWxTD domain-containing protein
MWAAVQTKLSASLLIIAAVVLTGMAAAKNPPDEQKELREWAKGPVQYIMSDSERTAWKQLKTDEERQRFIEQFWRLRNPRPSPYTSQNEYKEEFYRRVSYANDHFGGDVSGEGWRTERGKYYILLGPPQSRAPFKGYGQLYPMELWFYSSRGLPNLPPFFYLLFYQRDDVGDYRRYSPFVDGPLKLVKGTFRDAADAYKFLKGIDAELARASLTLVTGEPIDLQTFTPSMESETLVAKIHNLPNALEKDRKLMREYVTAKVAYNVELFEATFFPVREGADQYGLHYAVQMDPQNFSYGQGEGAHYLSWNVHLKLYDPKLGKLVLDKEREVKVQYSEPEFDKIKDRPFSFEDKVSVPPGRYTAEITLLDRVRNQHASVTKTISVFEDRSRSLTIGDLVLFYKYEILQPQPAADRAAAFQFHNVKFFPYVKPIVANQEVLHVLFQVFLASERLAGDGKIALEYTIVNFGDSSRRFSFTDEVSKAKFDKTGSLLNSKTLSVRDLPAGRYSLTVKVTDAKDGFSAVRNIFFDIVSQPASQKPNVFYETARISN